jgi:hypothetical protein
MSDAAIFQILNEVLGEEALSDAAFAVEDRQYAARGCVEAALVVHSPAFTSWVERLLRVGRFVETDAVRRRVAF